MKKALTIVALLFALGGVSLGQMAVSYTNATSTGTTVNSLASINSSNQAVISSTSQTTVPVFIVVAGAGTTGQAALAVTGIASCTMDTTVASGAGGYFVINSTTTGGDCHPQSAAPAIGTFVVGYLAAGSTSSGSAALVQVDPYVYAGGAAASNATATVNGQSCALGGTCNVNSGAASGSIAANAGNGNALTAATAHQISAPLGCADTSGSGTAQSCTTSPSFTPAAGDCIIYTTITANTGSGLTINVNSLGAKSVAKWQGATSLTAGDIAANKQVPMCYDGTNWETTTIGNAPSGGGAGNPCTSISNSIQYDNAGSFGCAALEDLSNDLSNTTSTQAQTYQGGTDASANAAGGGVTLRGAAQTGAGGSSSAGGGTLVAGGGNAATSTASTAGDVELQAGQSTGSSSTGLQGLMLITQSYAQSGTVTQWDLVCHTGTANAVTNCGTTPQNIAGVAVALSGTVSVLVAEPGSEVPINASAAVTLGDAVYGGGTAGKITDCGASSGCQNGTYIGQVIATTGTWQAYPDGTAFPTLSTTLPLIKLANIALVSYVNNSNGPVNVSGAESGGVTLATGNAIFDIFANNSGTSYEAGNNVNGWGAGQSFANYVTVPLKATAALTAGQVVKSDTSNAESVVVATTTDTGAGVPISFVTNSPGTGAIAHIAAPGSLIYTPKLGTGTCTLGQFVIVDTTTNGDVKCTGTFTAGTILGRVIVAQSTVGSAVGVFVWPQ